MSEKLDGIIPKIVLLFRMLTSSADGEIINAVRALLRLLASHGFDIHDLVVRIEHGGDEPLSAAEMQKIYDKGFEDGFAKGTDHGRRSVILASSSANVPWHLSGSVNGGVNGGVNGYNWAQIAAHCAANAHLFSGKAHDFVESMPEKIAAFGSPTPGQAKWLRDLFMQKFSGRI